MTSYTEVLNGAGTELGFMLANGGLDPGACNRLLRDLAKTDISLACVVWRQMSNAMRLATAPAHEETLDALLDGEIVATAFFPERCSAVRQGNHLRVTGAGLLTTGVQYAKWVLVEAMTEEGSCAIVVPAEHITESKRPEFVGIREADNAIISIEGSVPLTAVLGSIGGARVVVEIPYAGGLSMGAVACGGAVAVLGLLDGDHEARHPVEQRVVGDVTADVAAAWAAVELSADRAPDAAWWSRVAKVAASRASLRACEVVERVLGARTYAEAHPLNRLSRDLRGLSFQAPTDAGAAQSIARQWPAEDPN